MNNNNSQVPSTGLIQTDIASVLSPQELAAIDAELKHTPYPAGAAIDALKIVQQQRGWVSDSCLQAIAKHLHMSVHELDGIATFYNLIYRQPVGKEVILFCNSVSCWLCGSDQIKEKISNKLGIDFGQTSADGRYTLIPVPCLGACDKAPVMMLGEQLISQLDEQKLEILTIEDSKPDKA